MYLASDCDPDKAPASFGGSGLCQLPRATQEQQPNSPTVCGYAVDVFGFVVDSSQLQKDIRPATATALNGTHLDVDNGTNDLGDLSGTVGSGSAAEGTASACCLLVDEKNGSRSGVVSQR